MFRIREFVNNFQNLLNDTEIPVVSPFDMTQILSRLKYFRAEKILRLTILWDSPKGQIYLLIDDSLYTRKVTFMKKYIYDFYIILCVGQTCLH